MQNRLALPSDRFNLQGVPDLSVEVDAIIDVVVVVDVSYLLSRRLDMTSIITNKFADMPRPETKKMIPAAENGSS